jgi:exodeoxyribonuclease VII small subunit
MTRRTTPQADTADPAPSPAEGATFEASIKRLTEIVSTLERGDLPLEESLRLFEEGVKL